MKDVYWCTRGENGSEQLSYPNPKLERKSHDRARRQPNEVVAGQGDGGAERLTSAPTDDTCSTTSSIHDPAFVPLSGGPPSGSTLTGCICSFSGSQISLDVRIVGRRDCIRSSHNGSLELLVLSVHGSSCIRQNGTREVRRRTTS
jgi:hypothetical protein